MTRSSRPRLALAAAVVAMTVSAPTTSGAQVDCTVPTTNALLSAEAAISRPALQSPSEFGLSNTYAQVEQATFPQFVYAEAGPQFAGAFEALVPAGTPPPPRAVAAYPSEDIPDESTSDWGGVSHAEVTPISGAASSSGGRELGGGGATAENARAWVASTVECDVITVIAGWSASNVVLAPGVTVTEMGERLTLVVSPDGSSADVEVTLVGLDGAEGATIEGRPLDPFTDPVRENGGPTLEAGEPRAESSRDGATAKGGGFNFLFEDPETGRGAGYRLGSIQASIEVLGDITRASPDVAQPTPVVDQPVISPPAAGATSPGPSRSVTGTPPPPSQTALDIERVATTDVAFSAVTVTTRSWYPLIVLAAVLATLASSYGAARVNRQRFPTLDWLFVKGDRKALRFVATYLKW